MDDDRRTEESFDDELAAVRARLSAEQAASMRRRGREIGGVPGVILAGALIALRDIYEKPQSDQGSVVVDAPDEPIDVDRDGITLDRADIGGTADVDVPALEPRAPLGAARRRARRPRL